MRFTRPNHALQRTAASRRGCNPRAWWPPSLSLGRSAPLRRGAAGRFLGIGCRRAESVGIALVDPSLMATFGNTTYIS